MPSRDEAASAGKPLSSSDARDARKGATDAGKGAASARKPLVSSEEDDARRARLLRSFRLGFAAQLGLVALIAAGAYLGYLPTSLRGIPGSDKVGHALLIGPLAFFLDGALELRPLVPGFRFPRLAPVLVLAVAGIEEYLQRFSAWRSSSFADYAADIVGVCFFSWLAARLSRRRR